MRKPNTVKTIPYKGLTLTNRGNKGWHIQGDKYSSHFPKVEYLKQEIDNRLENQQMRKDLGSGYD